MESNITFKDEKYELCEDFIDIGYMAENFEVTDVTGETKEIKRSHSDGSMSLFISFPDTSDNFSKEILKIDQFMSKIQVPIKCYFIFNEELEDTTVFKNRLKKFEMVFDSEDEFGNMYGTKIVSGSLENKLTKALFLISKDGAVFFLDMPTDLEKEFDLERLQVELNKAYITYTGVGCH
jgi:peroxiredoxin